MWLICLPSKVIKYNKNSNWIIAKSMNNANTTFWIIDKIFFPGEDDGISKLIKNNIFGPMDSLEFCKQLKERNIKLRLEPN